MESDRHKVSGTPSAFGAELRRLREQAGVELDQIVAETKVSRHTFEQIERGEFAGLPEKVFCRNFLRQYVAVIGGDTEEVLGQFDVAWDRFLLASGTFSTVGIESIPQPRTIRWWYWLPIILAALVITTVIGFMIRGARPIDGELTPDPRRSGAAQPSPRLEISPTPEFIVEQMEPTQTAEPQNGRRVVALIRVEESSECWLRYRDGTGATGQKLLDGGDEWTLDVEGPVLLTLGNAAAATLEIGGTVHRGLGRAGQVVHLRLVDRGFTREGSGDG